MSFTKLAKASALAILTVTSTAFAEPADWGPDDQIGAANRVSPDSVKAAAGLITTGKTYALGTVLDERFPAYPPRKMSVTVLQPNQAGGLGDGHTHASYNDDIFTGWLGIGSQIDGLGHVGRAHEYYNGNKAIDFAKPGGLTKLGVENIPPIAARGVMLDMTKHFGQERLDAGQQIDSAAIKAAAKAQGVELREGDVVLFHTGWLSLLTGETPDPATYSSGEPGVVPDGAKYLAEIGVIAVGADSWGMEAVPFAEGAGVFEVHQILLKDHGIYILENMVTAELAADGVHEFFFVLGVSRIKGAVQMIINPVAIR